MARVDKPQEFVLSAGSSGSKADIDIESPQFRAIQNLGANVKGLIDARKAEKQKVAQEGQRLVDKGVDADVERESKTWSKLLEDQVKQAGIDGGYDKQVEVFQNQLEEREKRFREQIAHASPIKKQELQAQWEDDKEALQVDFEIARAQEARDLANAKIVANATQLAESGDLESAMDEIASADLSEPEKIKISSDIRSKASVVKYNEYMTILSEASIETAEEAKRRIESDDLLNSSQKRIAISKANSAIKSGVSEDESTYLKFFADGIESSESINEAQSIEIDDRLSDKAKAQAQIIKNRKVAKLTVDSTRRIRSYNNQLLETGEIPQEVFFDKDVSEYQLDFYRQFQKGISGPLGQTSVEFVSAKSNLNNALGELLILQGDSPEYAGFSKKEAKKLAQEAVANAKSLLSSGDLAAIPAIQLIDAISKFDAIDAMDGNMQSANPVKELGDSEKRAYQLFQNEIAKMTRGRDGKAVDLTDIAIDPSEISFIYEAINSYIESGEFENKTPGEVDSFFNDHIIPAIDLRIQNSSIRRLEEYLFAE